MAGANKESTTKARMVKEVQEKHEVERRNLTHSVATLPPSSEKILSYIALVHPL